MNRFEKLCSIYRSNFQDFQEYKKESFAFAQGLLDAMVSEFGVPAKNIRLWRADKPEECTKELEEAMLLSDDSFWHLRMGINLELDVQGAPKQNLGFEVLFKRTGGKFMIRLPEERKFDMDQDYIQWDFKPFLDFLYEFLLAFYENDLDRFLNKEERTQLGFRIDTEEN